MAYGGLEFKRSYALPRLVLLLLHLALPSALLQPCHRIVGCTTTIAVWRYIHVTRVIQLSTKTSVSLSITWLSHGYQTLPRHPPGLVLWASALDHISAQCLNLFGFAWMSHSTAKPSDTFSAMCHSASTVIHSLVNALSLHGRAVLFTSIQLHYSEVRTGCASILFKSAAATPTCVILCLTWPNSRLTHSP